MPERVLQSLHLADVGIDAFSIEALAASIRRAASFLCPTTPRALGRAVEEVLRSIPGFTPEISDLLETIVNNLVAYGDLVEMSAIDSSTGGRQLFLAPPAYVRRTSGAYVLLGVRPDGVELLGDALADRVDYEGHARYLPSADDLDEIVSSTDLIEHSATRWLKAPRVATAEELLSLFVERLDVAGYSGEIVSPRILDSTASVTYYRGRWREPKGDDEGRFVARMPQRFGADLWCFAQVSEGQIVRAVVMPLRADIGPAADEAWRLQAAIDSTESHPQVVRVRASRGSDAVILDLFAPLPSWAQRRLDIVGTPLVRDKGALFAYAVPASEVEEEVAFLAEMLWLEVQDETDRTTT